MKRKNEESENDSKKKAKTEAIECTYYDPKDSTFMKTVFQNANKCKIYVGDYCLSIPEPIMDMLRASSDFWDTPTRSMFSTSTGVGEKDVVIPYPDIGIKDIIFFIDFLIFDKPFKKANDCMKFDALATFLFSTPSEIYGNLEYLCNGLQIGCDPIVKNHTAQLFLLYLSKYKKCNFNTFKFFKDHPANGEDSKIRFASMVFGNLFNEKPIVDFSKFNLPEYRDKNLTPHTYAKWILNWNHDPSVLELFFREIFDFDLRASNAILAGSFMSAFYNRVNGTAFMKEVGDIDLFIPPEGWLYFIEWFRTYINDLKFISGNAGIDPYSLYHKSSSNENSRSIKFLFKDRAIAINIIPIYENKPDDLICDFDLPPCRIYYCAGIMRMTADFLYAINTGRMVYCCKQTMEHRWEKYFRREFVYVNDTFCDGKLFTYEVMKKSKHFLTMLTEVVRLHCPTGLKSVEKKTEDYNDIPFESLYKWE